MSQKSIKTGNAAGSTSDMKSSNEMRRKRRNNTKRWSLAIWAFQAILSVSFIMQGLIKIFIPNDQLGSQMAWVYQAPGWLVALIGLAEVFTAGFLLLPALFRFRPHYCIYAAWVLVGFMVVAITYHAVFSEFAAIPYNVAVLIMAGIVIWGRVKVDPIEPKETAD